LLLLHLTILGAALRDEPTGKGDEQQHRESTTQSNLPLPAPKLHQQNPKSMSYFIIKKSNPRMVFGKQHDVFHSHKGTQDSDFLHRTTSTTAMAAVAAAGETPYVR